MGAQDDVCTLRDELVEKSGVFNSFAASHRDWRVEAESLVADGVEEGQLF